MISQSFNAIVYSMLQSSGIKNENSTFKWKILFYYLMVENQNIENKPTYGICKEFCHLTNAADLFTF